MAVFVKASRRGKSIVRAYTRAAGYGVKSLGSRFPRVRVTKLKSQAAANRLASTLSRMRPGTNVESFGFTSKKHFKQGFGVGQNKLFRNGRRLY